MEARWPIRDRDRVGRGRESERLDCGKRPERPWTAARTMEVLRRCPLAIAQRLLHCAIALSTAVLDRVTKTMSVAPLLTNNLNNLKQKTSNLLSPAPPPYSWSLQGKSEGPAPPPSSKISWSFDLAWNPEEPTPTTPFKFPCYKPLTMDQPLLGAHVSVEGVPQVSFLLQWKFCRDKHMFVVTIICHDKSFVMASILLSRQKTCFCSHDICGSSH